MIDEAARDLLLRFRESIVVPLANTDADKWPIRSGRISRLCLDEFSSEFFEDIHSLRQQNMSNPSIAALFRNPTHFWRMSHHLLNGLRLLSAPLETQQQAILTLLELISYMKYGDIFCSDGANIVWSPAQVADMANDLRPIEEPGAAHLIHQLGGVLWAYAESLYFVAHELSVEIHGPYKVPGGYSLLVRDFFDLHPLPLWPFVDSLLPYKTARIMVLYKELIVHLDVYNNLYINAGRRLIDEASFYQVLIDGHTASLSQIQQLIREASGVIEMITKMVNSWSLEEIARQYIYIFWWRKAVLSNTLQKDWKPPEKVLKRVVERNIPDSTGASPSLEALRKQYDLL